jgi:hypothetical protein
MSPRVDPAAFPDPTQPVAQFMVALLERQAIMDRIRDLCSGAAFHVKYGGAAVYVRDVLAILDDPDPLGSSAGPVSGESLPIPIRKADRPVDIDAVVRQHFGADPPGDPDPLGR